MNIEGLIQLNIDTDDPNELAIKLYKELLKSYRTFHNYTYHVDSQMLIYLIEEQIFIAKVRYQ